MLPKDKIIVDGTKPSEGGEIEVDHLAQVLPGQTITPQQPKDEGLKPFNDKFEQDIDAVNNHQEVKEEIVPAANPEPVAQPQALQVNPLAQPQAPQLNPQPTAPNPVPQPLNNPQPTVNHAPEPDHSGMYSTNPAAAVAPNSGSFHPTKSVIGTPDNFNNAGPTIMGVGGVGTIANTPPSRAKKHKKLLIFIPILLLILAIAYFFVIYWPNTPQNVWNTGLNRTGKQVDAIVEKLNNKDALVAYDKTAIKLEGTLDSDGQKININLDSNYNTTSSDTKAALQAQGEDGALQLEAKIKTNLPQDALLPNIYFNISGIKDLGLEDFIPGISKYDGQWVAVEQDYLEQFEESLNGASNEQEAADNGPTYEEIISIANDFNSVTQQYLFNANPEYSILNLVEFVGEEESEGIKANHYKAGINKQNVINYCTAVVDKLASNKALKDISGLNDEDFAKRVQEEKDNCAKANEEVKDDETFDIWFDKKYKVLHKIRVYADNETYIQELQRRKQQDNYFECLSDSTKTDEQCDAVKIEPVDVEVDLGTEYSEFGQIVKSRQEVLTFTNYKKENKTDNTNLRLELNVNTDNFAIGGSVAYSSKTEYSNTSLNLKVTTEPYNGEIDAGKPSGAIPIKQMLQDILGTDNPYANVQSSARDSQRQSDISSLHTALEAYYVQYGQYPSFEQINDSEFRNEYLKGVMADTFADPAGASDKLADRVGVNVYSYVLVPASCNNKNVSCSYYELSAKLEDGNIYTKQSVQ